MELTRHRRGSERGFPSTASWLATIVPLALIFILWGPAPSAAQTAQEPPPPPEKPADEPPEIPKQDVRESLPPLTGADLVDADFPGSWPMFGKTVRMKIGGYVKADFLYDFDGTLDRQQFLMSTIPVEGSPEHGKSGYLSLFSRETRFNIDVRQIEKGKAPLRLLIEGDFWSPGNQLRLRHAYAVYGNLIIGQTWTTLSILESLPVLIDFAAGDALFGGRTTQVRYQWRETPRWKLAVALESLDFMGIENPSGAAGEPSAALPLVAVRADYEWNTGLIALGSSIAQLRWDGGASGPDADAVQWDAVLAGRQYLGKDDFVTWNLSYGIGSGENIMAFAGSNANAVLIPAGDLDTFPAFASVLGYMHRWNERISSNFSFAYGWLDTPDSRAPFALKRGGIGHANVIWRLNSQLSTGVEYMHGRQRATNDELGAASRIQAMMKMEF